MSLIVIQLSVWAWSFLKKCSKIIIYQFFKILIERSKKKKIANDGTIDHNSSFKVPTIEGGSSHLSRPIESILIYILFNV
jgi:hypothetical protein